MFESEAEAAAFVAAQELDLTDPADVTRIDAVRTSAVKYLRRHFDFPVPSPVANADLVTLLMMASGKGHRQLCACTVLKVMHTIHHLEARELLFQLPVSNEEVFHLVEQKVYRVIGKALAEGAPIVEFIGGRKNKDSLYTKLLSKSEATAAQIYDKLRFRVVTRSPDEIFAVLRMLQREVFPFNYVIPEQSTNTLLPFEHHCASRPTSPPWWRACSRSRRTRGPWSARAWWTTSSPRSRTAWCTSWPTCPSGCPTRAWLRRRPRRGRWGASSS
jgi:uncharacterized protein (TIGR04552 family)